MRNAVTTVKIAGYYQKLKKKKYSYAYKATAALILSIVIRMLALTHSYFLSF